MLLAIDAGNSFVKLAYHDTARWVGEERIALDDFPSFALDLRRRPAPASVVIANVAGQRFSDPMRDVLTAWGLSARWVCAEAHAYGVTNCYARPERLGADRWAALIAARQLRGETCLVVSIGTAVTVDLLTGSGEFAGGMILPGVELMRQCLAGGTIGIGPTAGAYSPCPTNTDDGVHTGALFAIAGAIEKRLAELDGAASLILTGGGADEVARMLKPPVRIVPGLVLEGLLVIARAEGML
jgi:type III pantothenate kinase